MQDNENLICIISKYFSTLLLISKRWLNILFFLLHELLSLRMLHLEVVGSTWKVYAKLRRFKGRPFFGTSTFCVYLPSTYSRSNLKKKEYDNIYACSICPCTLHGTVGWRHSLFRKSMYATLYSNWLPASLEIADVLFRIEKYTISIFVRRTLRVLWAKRSFPSCKTLDLSKFSSKFFSKSFILASMDGMSFKFLTQLRAIHVLVRKNSANNRRRRGVQIFQKLHLT